MTIHPCVSCRLSVNCDIKRAKLKAVRGLGLTSIKFRCEKQREDLRSGDVVMADLRWVCLDVHEGKADFLGEPNIGRAKMRAVFMGWARAKGHEHKARIFVPRQDAGCLIALRKLPDDANQRFVVRVLHRQLTPTGEHVRACKHCGMPESATEEERGEWVCRMEPSRHDDYLTGYSPQPLDCEYI